MQLASREARPRGCSTTSTGPKQGRLLRCNSLLLSQERKESTSIREAAQIHAKSQTVKLGSLLESLAAAFTEAPSHPAATALQSQRHGQRRQHQQQQRHHLHQHLMASSLDPEPQALLLAQPSRAQGDPPAKKPSRSKAVNIPMLSDAALTVSIASARHSSDLVQLFMRERGHMNIIHISFMMRRLALMVEKTASHRRVMSTNEGRTWVALRDKALLTVRSAQPRQVLDILTALHRVAAAREQHHLGWTRPGGGTASNGAQAGGRLRKQNPKHKQQPWEQVQEQAINPRGVDELQDDASHHMTDTASADGCEACHPSGRASDGKIHDSSNGSMVAAGAANPKGATHVPLAFANAGILDPSADAVSDLCVRHHVDPGWSDVSDHQAEGASAGSTMPSVSRVQGNERSARQHDQPSVRPLHSTRVLQRYERDLLQAALHHSVALMLSPCQPLPVQELLSLGSVVGRLGFATADPWQLAFFTATLPHLPRLAKAEMAALASAVARLQPVRRPPAAWLAAFYARSQYLVNSMDARELCYVLTATSRLPQPYPDGWVDSVVRRCSECLDSLDAPGFALVLHSLGRMRQRWLRPWVQELVDSSITLLFDFSPEELSLVLRGCAMLRVSPDSDWYHEFFLHSHRSLKLASGPQLVNMGWALAVMRCMPPRQWVHEWLLQLHKRLHAGGRPLGVPKDMWHGVGYAVHAKRAVIAIAAFRGVELEEWCRWLRTPVPSKRRPVAVGVEEPRMSGPLAHAASEQSLEQEFMSRRSLLLAHHVNGHAL